MKLTPAARAVLVYLAYRAGNKGKSWGRSQTDFAEELNYTDRTIRNSLKTLTGHGLITIHRQGAIASEYIPNFEMMMSLRPEIPVSANGQNVRSVDHGTDSPVLDALASVTRREDGPKTGKNFHPDRKSPYLRVST